MRISLQVALGYFLIVGLADWFVLNVFVAEVKPGVREAMEDTLVDTANLVAELVAPDLAAAQGARDAQAPQAGLKDRVTAALDAYTRRTVTAGIWNIEKRSLAIGSTSPMPPGRWSLPEEGWEKKYLFRKKGYSLEWLLGSVTAHFEVTVKVIQATSKVPRVTKARAAVCHVGARKLGVTSAAIAKELGISTSAVSKAIARTSEASDLDHIEEQVLECQ